MGFGYCGWKWCDYQCHYCECGNVSYLCLIERLLVACMLSTRLFTLHAFVVAFIISFCLICKGYGCTSIPEVQFTDTDATPGTGAVAFAVMMSAFHRRTTHAGMDFYTLPSVLHWVLLEAIILWLCCTKADLERFCPCIMLDCVKVSWIQVILVVILLLQINLM